MYIITYMYNKRICLYMNNVTYKALTVIAITVVAVQNQIPAVRSRLQSQQFTFPYTRLSPIVTSAVQLDIIMRLSQNTASRHG